MTFLQFLSILGAAALLALPIFAIPYALGERDALPSIKEAGARIGASIRVIFYTVLVIVAAFAVIGFLTGHPIFLLVLLLCGACGSCGATSAQR